MEATDTLLPYYKPNLSKNNKALRPVINLDNRAELQTQKHYSGIMDSRMTTTLKIIGGGKADSTEVKEPPEKQGFHRKRHHQPMMEDAKEQNNLAQHSSKNGGSAKQEFSGMLTIVAVTAAIQYQGLGQSMVQTCSTESTNDQENNQNPDQILQHLSTITSNLQSINILEAKVSALKAQSSNSRSHTTVTLLNVDQAPLSLLASTVGIILEIQYPHLPDQEL
ncbi:hypothetical protein CR513_01320 [Mucuna pruriens]|uniref:Uncharacterized protein n=1 Tax=Mucuna pruriens TaxID=157652 RepID=A0A371IFA4_MUCPR|nr:hypothetical protein CR513_01320 [Mucuna pruriens]